MPRISQRVLAEDRLDMRGVGIHVRDHDDDIPRPELRVTVKGVQQLVVQNLDFALRAVSQVELDRAIILAIHGGPAFAGFRQRAELQHILLQLLQQRPAAGLFKQINAAAIDRGKACLVAGALVMAVEQVDIVATLLAPGGQQGMRMLVQGAVIQLHRTIGPPLLAPVLMAQQILVGNDIAPVILARIQHTEQYLAEAADGGQGFQSLGRQRGNAEHDNPTRQPVRTCVHRKQLVDKARMNTGAAVTQTLITYIDNHRAPECWLPHLLHPKIAIAVARQTNPIAALGPVIQPVSAVDLVLIEQVGQTFGQLVTLATISIVGQKTSQGRKLGLVQQPRQQAHQPPGQGLLVQRRLLGHRLTTEHGAVGLPEKARGQLHIQCRGNTTTSALAAGVSGQRQLQPLGDAVALHQHHLVLQRMQRMLPGPADHQLTQRLQAVAMNDHQAGFQRAGVLHQGSGVKIQWQCVQVRQMCRWRPWPVALPLSKPGYPDSAFPRALSQPGRTPAPGSWSRYSLQ